MTDQTFPSTTEAPSVAGRLDQPVRPAADARRYGRFTAPAEWAHQFRTELKRVMGMCALQTPQGPNLMFVVFQQGDTPQQVAEGLLNLAAKVEQC